MLTWYYSQYYQLPSSIMPKLSTSSPLGPPLSLSLSLSPFLFFFWGGGGGKGGASPPPFR